MQVKTITVNGAGMMTARKGISEKGNPTKTEGSMFGPECRVSISREGRNLSGQQTAQAKTVAQDMQSVKEEKPSKLKEILRDIFEECGLKGDRLRERVDGLYEEIIRDSKGDLEVTNYTVTEEEMEAMTNLIGELKKVNYMDMEIDPSGAQDLMQVAQEYKVPNSRKAD